MALSNLRTTGAWIPARLLPRFSLQERAAAKLEIVHDNEGWIKVNICRFINLCLREKRNRRSLLVDSNWQASQLPCSAGRAQNNLLSLINNNMRVWWQAYACGCVHSGYR